MKYLNNMEDSRKFWGWRGRMESFIIISVGGHLRKQVGYIQAYTLLTYIAVAKYCPSV